MAAPTPSPAQSPAPSSATKLLVFLGGGNWRDIPDDEERASYSTAGFIVLVNAAIIWVVTAAALATAGGVNPAVAIGVTLLFALLVGAVGRVLASRMALRGPRLVAGDLVRVLVGLVLGLVVGELAALALFSGPVDAELNRQVDQARATVAQSEQARRLEQLRGERGRLDRAVDATIARRDEARVVARCEYNPTPGCPDVQITGDPGAGDATTQAERALTSAEADLAGARTERDTRAPALERDIAAQSAALAQDRAGAEALARADDGVDARWLAMHEYTTAKPVALVLRLGVDVLFVVLNLLPLLLRLLRGETVQDTRIRSRRRRLQAEDAAETELAVKRAEQLIAAGPPLALPAGAGPEEVDVVEEPADQPLPIYDGVLQRVEQPAPSAEVDVPRPGLRLPGPLPAVGRVLAGVVNPVRTARTILEEVEEIRFTLTRRRRVSVHTNEPADAESARQPEQEPQPPRRIVTAERQDLPLSTEPAGVTAAARRELSQHPE